MPPSERPPARGIVTPSDHGLLLHDGGRGFVTIAQRESGYWREHAIPILELEDFLRQIDPRIDSYISQNRFFRPWRRIAYLVQADALFTDLDYYTTELWDYAPRRILQRALILLDECNIPGPTFANTTGRGIALVWLHSPIPRSALPRWRACQMVISRILKSIGADPNALDAARVLRLIGTRNSRSGTLVETISPVGQIWDFDMLATEILPVCRDKIREKRRRREELKAEFMDRQPVSMPLRCGPAGWTILRSLLSIDMARSSYRPAIGIS
jgi:hypothetical protein